MHIPALFYRLALFGTLLATMGTLVAYRLAPVLDKPALRNQAVPSIDLSDAYKFSRSNRPERYLRLSSVGSPKVYRVGEDTPLYELGLREGDTIVSVNGKPVPNREAAYQYLTTDMAQAGQLEVGVRRGSALLSLRAEKVVTTKAWNHARSLFESSERRLERAPTVSTLYLDHLPSMWTERSLFALQGDHRLISVNGERGESPELIAKFSHDISRYDAFLVHYERLRTRGSGYEPMWHIVEIKPERPKPSSCIPRKRYRKLAGER